MEVVRTNFQLYELGLFDSLIADAVNVNKPQSRGYYINPLMVSTVKYEVVKVRF